jgi:hypothetical protein
MEALFFTCIGVIVVIVMLLEFPGDLTRKPGILDRPRRKK